MPTDEKLAEVSIPARHLFTMGLMFFDDAGRMEYSPKRLKMQIFPAKRDMDLEIEPLIDELCEPGLWYRYEVTGRRYVCVPNFLKHQRTHKPTPSVIPAPQSVPHGTPIKNREDVEKTGESGEKVEVLEVEVELEKGKELEMEVGQEIQDGFVDEWFEQLSKAHPRAERGPAAQNQFLEALQWKMKRQGWTPQEAARWLVRRANDYREQTTFWTGLERWLRNKVFEQDWSEGGKPTGKGEQQFNRIDAERKKAIANIRAEGVGG